MYRTYDIREKILLGLFYCGFINFLGPIVDPDFPFHIKTGEYIYQHKEIPEDDPFSFMVRVLSRTGKEFCYHSIGLHRSYFTKYIL